MQNNTTQLVITCPYCGWMAQGAAPLPEHIECMHCQRVFEPAMAGVVPLPGPSRKTTSATTCLHPDLQDAAGMTYCPACGKTEW